MQRLRILAVLLVALVVTTGLLSDSGCGHRNLQLQWKSGFSPPSLVRMSGEGPHPTQLRGLRPMGLTERACCRSCRWPGPSAFHSPFSFHHSRRR